MMEIKSDMRSSPDAQRRINPKFQADELPMLDRVQLQAIACVFPRYNISDSRKWGKKELIKFISEYGSWEQDLVEQAWSLVINRRALNNHEVKDEIKETKLQEAKEIAEEKIAEASILRNELHKEREKTRKFEYTEPTPTFPTEKPNEDTIKVIDELMKTAVKQQDKIKELEEKGKTFEMPEPDKSKESFDSIMPDLERAIKCRKDILLVGPSGCGKTTIPENLAAKMDMEFSAQSFSEGISESYLYGWLIPFNGGMKYVQSEFVRLYENGGLFLGDELDGADPNLLIAINMARANGVFYCPQRTVNGLPARVEKHKDFVFIGAANTLGLGGDDIYERNKLDGATLDRFRSCIFEIDYSTQYEKDWICEMGEGEDETIRDTLVNLLAWVWSVRKIIVEHDLGHIMSTRTLKDFADLIMAGANMIYCTKRYFSDWHADEIAFLKGEK